VLAPASGLVDIPEVQILPICQISKGSRIQISFLLTLNLGSSSILAFHQEPEGKHNADFDEMADNHAPNAQLIAGRLIGFVKEGTGDISRAVSQEQHCVSYDLLRMACSIRDLQREYHDKRSVVWSRQ